MRPLITCIDAWSKQKSIHHLLGCHKQDDCNNIRFTALWITYESFSFMHITVRGSSSLMSALVEADWSNDTHSWPFVEVFIWFWFHYGRHHTNTRTTNSHRNILSHINISHRIVYYLLHICLEFESSQVTASSN